MDKEQKDFIDELHELLKRHDVTLHYDCIVEDICVSDDNSFQRNNAIVDCRKSKGRDKYGRKLCNTTT